MWTIGWRDRIWSDLNQRWDVIIIGGGITGAGILREARHAGLNALLLEACDFAAGTSSRSSKLVHGGLRYLRNAQVRVTMESVAERERLLREGKGLINRLGFLYTSLQGDRMPAWVFGIGLLIYDLMAMQWSHRRYRKEELRALCPPLTTPALKGGYRYIDAVTDDARLVLRVIQEAVRDGGTALNYARVERLLTNGQGRVCGVAIRDMAPGCEGREVEIQSPVVINATGAWMDRLRSQIGKGPRLRPLRGSHLIIPAHRLPLLRAVSLLHPRDGRPVYAIPWEGVILVGTTDVDHQEGVTLDPGISPSEVDYLLEAVNHVFPDQLITTGDIQASLSGIRAVVDTGKANPSKESREHLILEEDGLLSVSGGKLTTFRLMARDALIAGLSHLDRKTDVNLNRPVLDASGLEVPPADPRVNPSTFLRLLGRYGHASADLLNAAKADELVPIGSSPFLWAELRWAARAEAVLHLDDLLLRRVRLGLTLPQGGRDFMKQIRSIVQPELGWDDQRWRQEEQDYVTLWEASYSLPPGT